jgi:hypothetical protein
MSRRPRGLPKETATGAEHRAIRRGRAEIKRGHFVTLDQPQVQESAGAKARSYCKPICRS